MLVGSSMVIALSLMATAAFALDYTWNNSGTTDFATGANWGGTAPSDSLTADRAIFIAENTVIPSLSTVGNVGVLNLTGMISGAAWASGLNFSGNSAFRSTIHLTGANTYTGTTKIQNVTVTANSLADSGASVLGFGGLTLGTFDGLANHAEFLDDLANTWRIQYDDTSAGANGGTGAGFVTSSAVREPNTAALLASMGLLRRRR